MKLKEAREILGISENATPEEIKKRYRDLSKKYHPDLSKEPDAEEKFKKINEAHNRIQSGEEDVDQNMRGNPWGGMNPFDGFFGGGFSRQAKQYSSEHISIHTKISFKESVLGVKKEISFCRKNKCSECNGVGEFKVNNGCDKCNGRGQSVYTRGTMAFVQTCDKCMGRVSRKKCNKCSTSGMIETDVTVTVSIPGGVSNGNILRLAGMGNFAGQFVSMDQFTDAHLYIEVEEEPGLTLDGTTVISNLEISLLEALKGCSKTVKTILGEKEININPASKNKDEVIIPNLGVNNKGDQKVILSVTYPDDLSNLIKLLEE